MVLALACLVALLCSGPGLAAELYGRVVGVSDGDTITVLDTERVTHKIRLSGIDAPEKAQPFGERAKQQLSTQNGTSCIRAAGGNKQLTRPTAVDVCKTRSINNIDHITTQGEMYANPESQDHPLELERCQNQAG